MEPIWIQQADLGRGRASGPTWTGERNHVEAGHAFADPADGVPLIDLGRALDLIATAATQHVGQNSMTHPYTTNGGPGIVRRALSLGHVRHDDLAALRDHGVRELYQQGKLRTRLTLGALAVLDAAQRSEDRGYTCADALDYATSVAERFLNLLPDPVLTPDRITPAQPD